MQMVSGPQESEETQQLRNASQFGRNVAQYSNAGAQLDLSIMVVRSRTSCDTPHRE